MELQIKDWDGWEKKGTTWKDTAVIYDKTKGGFLKSGNSLHNIYGFSTEVTDDIEKALHFNFSDKFSPEEKAMYRVLDLKSPVNCHLGLDYKTFMEDELEVLKVKITRSFSYEVTDCIKTE